MPDPLIESSGTAEPAGPRISVILVVRNQAEELRRSVAALERSTLHKLLEILVVDKASRDPSAEIDHEFPDVQVLRLPKDFGATRALNIGVRSAHGEYVLLLPAGAEVEPQALERMITRLGDDMTVGGVCPAIASAHPMPTAEDLKAFCATGDFPRSVPVTQNEQSVDFPRNAPLMVRRNFILNMNYFDERYGEFGPYLELCYQIKASGKKILVLQDADVTAVTPPREDSAAFAVDRVHGSALYLSKHGGSGFGFRLGQAFSALGSIFSFRSLGYDFQRLTGILGGQKIDGNQ